MDTGTIALFFYQTSDKRVFYPTQTACVFFLLLLISIDHRGSWRFMKLFIFFFFEKFPEKLHGQKHKPNVGNVYILKRNRRTVYATRCVLRTEILNEHRGQKCLG